jgi:hypothetical protein
MHPYMKRAETAEQVRRWFQAEVGKLWPVAIGSLSLRKSPCIREHCQLCESGQGHSSHALYGRKGDRRFAVYVPEDVAQDVVKAIHNGRTFQGLLSEAGRRYTLANTLYCSFAYSALACLKIGMSALASFHKARNV